MEFLNYFLVSVVCYLGVIAGYILMLVAPEEKKPGMRYFNAVHYSLFIFSVLFVFIFRFQDISFIICGLLALIVFYVLRNYGIYISYLWFSVIFYLFSEFSEFLVFAAIIFAYGLVSGAVICDLKDKRNSLLKVLSLAYFIIIVNLLRLVL